MKDCDAYADATNGAELLGLQDVLKRMESELAQLRTAAWSQHQAQTQIRSVRFRTKAERAAVSVVLSDLHFKVHFRLLPAGASRVVVCITVLLLLLLLLLLPLLFRYLTRSSCVSILLLMHCTALN